MQNMHFSTKMIFGLQKVSDFMQISYFPEIELIVQIFLADIEGMVVIGSLSM